MIQMMPATAPANYAPRPTYEELVNTLELIQHATAPEPADGGEHEAAHDLAAGMLDKVKARRAYEASLGATRT